MTCNKTICKGNLVSRTLQDFLTRSGNHIIYGRYALMGILMILYKCFGRGHAVWILVSATCALPRSVIETLKNNSQK